MYSNLDRGKYRATASDNIDKIEYKKCELTSGTGVWLVSSEKEEKSTEHAETKYDFFWQELLVFKICCVPLS